MRITYCYLFIFIWLLLSVSCKDKILDSNKYIEWVEDKENGLLVEYSSNDLLLRLQYKPAEYILIKENKIADLNKTDLFKSKDEVNGLYYFNFNISSLGKEGDVLKKGNEDTQRYIELLHYFSYEAQHDFKLLEGKDTLDCILYHFERSYGLSPYNTVVLGFEKSEINKSNPLKDLTLFYNDQAFGQGKISLKIKATHINNIPKLIIDEKSNT